MIVTKLLMMLIKLLVWWFFCQIPLVADLPVGNNLQDHLWISKSLTINQSLSVLPAKAAKWLQIAQYLFNGGGKS